MAYRIKSRNLSVIIPSTPDSTQTDTETTVDGNGLSPQFAFQPYYSPASPLKHPFRFRGIVDPTTPVKSNTPQIVDTNISLKAEDIASPDLVAVANLFASMKQTLDCMTKTFDALSEQSERMSSLTGEVKRVEDIRHIKFELEEQISRQKEEVLGLRERLEGEVRIALEEKLRERLTFMIQESVAKEVEERVRQELAVQIPQKFRDEIKADEPDEREYYVQPERDTQHNPDILLYSPERDTTRLPKIPILLYQESMGGEAENRQFCNEESQSNVPISPFFYDDHVYPRVRIPVLLFDESREHEPPPPSPVPMAGPLRPLLRPLPTPEQSPAYIVHRALPSRSASSCSTPVTAYPRVPAPTPITNEPILMVLPMRSAPISALSPVAGSPSAFTSGDLDLLFALSSEQNKKLFGSHDSAVFFGPTPMAEWPKARTIVKTPTSWRSSPLMIPPPLDIAMVSVGSGSCSDSSLMASVVPPEIPVLIVPPRQPRGGKSFANNLKMLPPLIIN